MRLRAQNNDALTEVFVQAEKGTNVGKNKSHVGNNVGETSTNVGEIGDYVGDNPQERIVELLSSNPTLSAAKLAEMLGLSKRHVERLLAELRAAGIIEHSGSARGGHWVVRS